MTLTRFSLRRLLPLVLAAVATIGATTAAGAMSPDERAKLDLSGYTVQHPGAGYFDLAARKAYVAATDDRLIRKEVEKLRRGVSCKQYLQAPPIKGDLLVPMLYRDPQGWKVAAKPFLDFEDAVSSLAAAQFVAADATNGKCLLDVLGRWAKEGAFLDLKFASQEGLQTWFQTEGSLLAAALAYSIVRDQVPGANDQKKAIENWLVAVAQHHLGRTIYSDDGSCCNNHFYRRAAYAAAIGVLVNDDTLFRFGMSAIYSALSEANPDGSLPREMLRGQLAARYQNYATMYLVFIAQIARMQGYDMFALNVNGRRLDDIVGMAIRMLKDPQLAAAQSGSGSQQTDFSRQNQYLAWLAMLPGLDSHATGAADVVPADRPLYNRSLGGFLTLYFAPPPAKTSANANSAKTPTKPQG
ncbi:MAG TPA: alginate lyase family protein [Bauldia sp.]|nr:alginate lyase family protein [Bauldia sp.]